MILDINFLIYASLPENKTLREYLKLKENDLVVASITKIEVLGYHKLTNSKKIFFEKFFNSIPNISLNQNIETEAIRLRQGRKMSLGDSIIAASGLIENLPIFTNNEKDFFDIEQLAIIPMKTII
jgi:predicted nucleic acid-binding protein